MSAWFAHYKFGRVGIGLYIGAYPQDADDVAALQAVGVTRVFNLVRDVEYQGDGRAACSAALAAAGIVEQRLEVADFGNVPPRDIERAATVVRGWLDESECVYVHCRAGMQRSATVAAAVVALEEQVTPAEALEVIRERNPNARPLTHQREDLMRWWQARGSG